MEPVVVVRQPGRRPLYVVLREPLVIGRECDGLVLDDRQVSRRHVELRTQHGQVVITDLGSTNGSFVDGERISDPASLTSEQTLTLGETTVRIVPPGPGLTSGARSTTIAPARRGAHDLRKTSIDVVADLVTADPWPASVGSDTLTILFSDIESHTERVSGMGDARWFEMLEQHNRLFRDELARAGGTEVKAQGDGFMLTFTSVRRALAFAVAVRARLVEQATTDPGGALRVRMGLHTGEAIADPSGDLIGRHVIKAARIANLATGGQILVSETVREIAAGDHGLSFSEGMHVELKGLDGVHTVYEVVDVI